MELIQNGDTTPTWNFSQQETRVIFNCLKSLIEPFYICLPVPYKLLIYKCIWEIFSFSITSMGYSDLMCWRIRISELLEDIGKMDAVNLQFIVMTLKTKWLLLWLTNMQYMRSIGPISTSPSWSINIL